MTTQERLEERLMLLIDLGCLIDRKNGLLIVCNSRNLDLEINVIKYSGKKKFTGFLEEVQEVFKNKNDGTTS